jgi:hypothetical protein
MNVIKYFKTWYNKKGGDRIGRFYKTNTAKNGTH